MESNRLAPHKDFSNSQQRQTTYSKVWAKRKRPIRGLRSLTLLPTNDIN
jgi:hypothetical protein